MTTHILDMTAGQLAEAMLDLGEKKFRTTQIREWIWRKGATKFEDMTNLSLALRQRLAEEFTVFSGRIAEKSKSLDGVVKLLLEWPDAQQIETVYIPSPKRVTACLSTQVGCAMGCKFCASGMAGLGRNLTAGEIIEQVLQLQAATGKHITNVVFMGMGEPLANYDATVSAVRSLIDPDKGGLSARRITVSTIGIPKAILRLAGEDIPLTLAISLHAPNDKLRTQLMPHAAKYSIDDIMTAAEKFFRSRNREVTLEYTLLAGVNDSIDCAEQLAAQAGRLRCNVNLIRYNPVSTLPFDRPTEQQVDTFAARLRRNGLNVNIRKSRGAETNAACGQLRMGNITQKTDES
ncbi:MAG: 23S rRNA (adenine(2503)-C(2))-methyltransferase RlmN [Phycisphaerae bacterium]|nr:23S rRNA (adenine(2503)-C(2))-methyltransferase RlmN [Phycisphaerae bacterium]